jgi:hypothetical protein
MDEFGTHDDDLLDLLLYAFGSQPRNGPFDPDERRRWAWRRGSARQLGHGGGGVVQAERKVSDRLSRPSDRRRD